MSQAEPTGEGAEYTDTISWSPDERNLAISNYVSAAILEAVSGKTVVRFDNQYRDMPYIYGAVWSPDGGTMATGVERGQIALWSPGTGKIEALWTVHDPAQQHYAWYPPTALAWSPDGRKIASGGSDGTARIWNPTNGKILWTFHIDSEVVSSVARSPDGKWLAISDDRLIRIYDTITGRSRIVIEGHTADVLALAWSPDGHRLASGSKDGTVRVWALPF